MSEHPGDRLIDPDVDRPGLVALVDKYERMLELRAVLGRGTPSPPHRLLMRSLAASFPGALRELERLPTAEISRRLALVTTDGLVPAWLVWTARYHVEMRTALRDKTARAPSGRLNVVVFRALAAHFGAPVDVIWERLFPSTSPRPHRHG